MDEIRKYIQASFPILGVRTYEPDRFLSDLQQMVSEVLNPNSPKQYTVIKWNCCHNGKGSLADEAIALLNEASDNTIMVAENFLALAALPQIQSLLNARYEWKERAKVFIITAPEFNIPITLNKSISILDYALPDKADLLKCLQRLNRVEFFPDEIEQLKDKENKTVQDQRILNLIAEYDSVTEEQKIVLFSKITKKFSDDNKEEIYVVSLMDEPEEDAIQASIGLTQFEAENAYAFSYVSKGKICPEIISEVKAQIVKKNASLDFGRYKETLSDVQGLDNMKAFVSKIIKSPLARGIIIYGVPGTGKSMFAKAIGNEFHLPCISLDFGRLFQKHVGGSESLARQAFACVDAMSPCILFIDEIEKGTSGTASSSETDGGTTDRVIRTAVTWLSDHITPVFVIATCNNVLKMSPEFIRTERWDAMFFVDLPNAKERTELLKYYKNLFEVPGNADVAGLTGAEIKTMCRLAKMMNITIDEGRRFVIPIAKSRQAEIEELRAFGKTKCLPASIESTEVPEKKRRLLPQNNLLN